MRRSRGRSSCGSELLEHIKPELLLGTERLGAQPLPNALPASEWYTLLVRGHVSRTFNAMPSRPSGKRTKYGSDESVSGLRAMMNSITEQSTRGETSTAGHRPSLPDAPTNG
jgi:hypothetical protein